MKNLKTFFFEIINSNKRYKFFILFFLSCIAMILEMFGVGIVYPIIVVILDGELPNFINNLLINMPFLKSNNINNVYFFLFLLIFIFFIKTLFFIFFNWYRAAFLRYLVSDVSQSLYNKYLSQNYSFHLERSSSTLMRNSYQTVNSFVTGYVDAILLYITQGLILLGILGFLLFIEPFTTIIIIFFFLTISIFFLKFSKKTLLKIGKERTIYEGFKMKLIQQGLGGAKEIKLLGKEESFFLKFKNVNNFIARFSIIEDLIRTSPKLIFEFFAVVAICLLVISLFIFNKENQLILPILAVFAAAGFRIIPSLNGIMLAQTKLRANYYVIDIISKDLSLKTIKSNINKNINLDEIQLKNKINISGLYFNYKTSKKNILNNLNFNIEINKTTGVIGKSGSGKTTLIDLILGLLDPKKGSIKIDNIDLKDVKREWQKSIGYVSQDIFLSDETLKENIALGENENEINQENLNYAIKLSKINEFVDDLPDGIETNIGTRGIKLSGGQRQRIGIARALYRRPKILVLDEATSSLDIETEKEVINSIENLQGKITIIIISHRLSALQSSDKIIELKKGEIIYEGSLKQNK